MCRIPVEPTNQATQESSYRKDTVLLFICICFSPYSCSLFCFISELIPVSSSFLCLLTCLISPFPFPAPAGSFCSSAYWRVGEIPFPFLAWGKDLKRRPFEADFSYLFPQIPKSVSLCYPSVAVAVHCRSQQAMKQGSLWVDMFNDYQSVPK